MRSGFSGLLKLFHFCRQLCAVFEQVSAENPRCCQPQVPFPDPPGPQPEPSVRKCPRSSRSSWGRAVSERRRGSHLPREELWHRCAAGRGGSDVEPGGLAGPPELALDILLAQRGVPVFGVDRQGVHGAADAEQTHRTGPLIWQTARFLCPAMLPRAAGFPRFSPGAANPLCRYPGHRSRRQPGPCPF
jgi:hypothetical protein